MLGLIGPESAHSPNAEDINALYWVMLVLGGALLVAINAALVALVLGSRGGRGRQARRLRSRGRVQTLAGLALGGLATIVFVLGVIFTESASEVEASGSEGLQEATAQRGLDLASAGETPPLEITASGQQWLWRYEYPDGTFSYYELVVPVDTAVVVNLISTDVIHRWWVPGLSAKADAVPGQSNRTWFKADEVGDYQGGSYAFSGPGYSTMRTRVKVLSVTDYEAWLEQQADDIAAAEADVQARLSGGGGRPQGEEVGQQ